MKNLSAILLVLGFVVFCACALLPAKALGAIRDRRAAKQPAAPMEDDVEAMLWAIRQRESGDDPRAVGGAGERTAYQFTETTWRRYTDCPFLLAAVRPETAGRVAAAHLAYLKAKLTERGIEAAPEFLAAAWRFGPGFALATVRTEYPRAVAALYEDRRARS